MKLVAALALALSLAAFAAEKPKAALASASVQSATETLDFETIARIRDEGFNHSHIMEYASGLFDGVGPRLTGSPDFAKAEQWSLEQLRHMGATNVHAESWGEFGMGWQQIATSVEMTAPSTATFLAQATPWSPATAGEATGAVIAVPPLKEEKDFAAWKGKLAGKIVLYGDAPKINPDPQNPLEHYDAAKLDHFRSYPLDGDQNDSFVLPNDPALWEKVFKEMAFLEKVGHFFADQHAIAVLRASGFGGDLHDDTGASLGWFVYRPEHKQAIPSAAIASEAFGRMHRLVSHGVPVSVRLNIATKFYGDHEPGSDVIGEIAGTDAFASAVASYAASHVRSPGLADAAAVHGYTTAFWWSVGIFILGFLLATLILPGRTHHRVPTARAALARLAVGNCHHFESRDRAGEGVSAAGEGVSATTGAGGR